MAEKLIRFDSSKHTQGECWRCNTSYVWLIGKPKLDDAYCPRCGTHLGQITYSFEGETVWEKPLTRARCPHEERVRSG
ncbi:hypothetical protein ACFLXA_05745 [Chloroflexota bacterium]